MVQIGVDLRVSSGFVVQRLEIKLYGPGFVIEGAWTMAEAFGCFDSRVGNSGSFMIEKSWIMAERLRIKDL